MYPEATYRTAMELIGEGLLDGQVGQVLGVPRTTIVGWRLHGRRRPEALPHPDAGGECPGRRGARLNLPIYSYLLGMYLGDGCLSKQPRGSSYKLRISCALAYPNIISEVVAAVVAIRGREDVGTSTLIGCLEVNSSWIHWPCLFPQHAPGPKHLRKIELRPWQQEIVTEYPWKLIRGLIQSDGCRHINRVVRPIKSGSKEYRYVRYQFTNASADIRAIFTDACKEVGVKWTVMGPRVIAISRRQDVEVLDRFVGPKS